MDFAGFPLIDTVEAVDRFSFTSLLFTMAGGEAGVEGEGLSGLQ